MSLEEDGKTKIDTVVEPGAKKKSGITRLLNRKSLQLQEANSAAAVSADKEPAVVTSIELNNPNGTNSFSIETSARPEIDLSPSPSSQPELELASLSSPQITLSSASESSPPTPSSTPAPTPTFAPSPQTSNALLRVQPSSRKAVTEVQKLQLWEPYLISAGLDPLGKGIYHLLKSGVSCVLFLAITSPPDGALVPHFVATAAVNPGQKLGIWTGLNWDPTITPEVWNQLVKSGHIEFPPPGNQTMPTSHRNVLRAAFGVRSSEWLLLVRTGPLEACRGIALFLSPKSMIPLFQEALPMLQAPAPIPRPMKV